MSAKKILVDDTNRELCEHGTEGFPLTVNHDNLHDFEGRNISIHWHNDLEIVLTRSGTAVYQIYEKTYHLSPGELLIINSNVPHSCHSFGNVPVRFTTILVCPDFLYGDFGSDIEKNCFRPFLQNPTIPCIILPDSDLQNKCLLEKLNQAETLFDQKPFCYELKIKGLLCDVFAQLLYEHQNEFSKFKPANQRDLKRLEQMLRYIHTHFDSVISLQQLSDHLHLSREVCCRLFKKMTGKTITAYLEEYRINKSLSLVQSGLYSITQIADMVGFSNASRFASAFRRQFGLNPAEYNSVKHKRL